VSTSGAAKSGPSDAIEKAPARGFGVDSRVSWRATALKANGKKN